MYKESGRVLVRAYGNEPKMMCFFKESDGVVMVHKAGSTVAIPYPQELLYEADQNLAEELERAYAQGHYSRVDSLWHKAKPITEEKCIA
jgi:hypothetical protein